MSKLTTNYVISWSQGGFTITWANNLYPAVSFNSNDYAATPFIINPNLFNFGIYGNYTTLDWRYETSLGSTNRTDLFNKISLMTTTLPTTTTVNTLAVNTGIYLPTVGGTPALLNYNEEHSSLLVLWGGCLAGTNTTSTLTFFRLGALVGCFIEGFQGIALSTGGITAPANTVPARFAPAVETEQIVIVNRYKWWFADLS